MARPAPGRWPSPQRGRAGLLAGVLLGTCAWSGLAAAVDELPPVPATDAGPVGDSAGPDTAAEPHRPDETAEAGLASGAVGSRAADATVDADAAAAAADANEAGAAAPDAAAAPASPQVWSLDQLVNRALRNNPRVLGQEQGQRAAKAGEAVARWEYFPTPAVQIETNDKDRLVTSSLTQPLFAFGRLGATYAAARAQSRAAGFRTEETRRDTALRVLDVYGQYASLTRNIAALGSDIERHLALEAMIHRRVEAGLSAPVDLNLVQTRINQSRILRTTLRGRQRAALVALAQLVGVSLRPEAIDVPAASAPDAPPNGVKTSEAGFFLDGQDPADLVQRSLERNPALQRADAEIAAAEAEARRAHVAMYPTIVARLENRTYTSGYPGNGLPDTRLTVGVSLNTGAGLSAFAGARAADARAQQATLLREALQQDVTSNVTAALETFVAARKVVEALRQNRLVQEQTAESYSRMFLAGKRSWLDVLNMVREQTSIERDLADAEVQLTVADFRLRIEAGDIA